MLDAPKRGRAVKAEAGDVRGVGASPRVRRDPFTDVRDDFGPVRGSGIPGDDGMYGDGPLPSRRRPGWMMRVRRRFPRSVVGRIAACAVVIAGFGVITYGLHEAQGSLLHDTRLTIPSSGSIEISGNHHLTRAQLLSVFGGDVDRNVLTVPLAGRRAELEALPWVEHATVMRLLPGRVRVSIVERTPVAFVRQGSEIGLVDRHGVLLDLAPDGDADKRYSFPVLTGLESTDPLSTRRARMELYLEFTSELDSGADKVTKRLSEIDLTDPEDVKALIPDGGTDVLVHFGQGDFIKRYRRYEQNLPDWKTRYPKLASADMRYEREVVLEMAAGASVPEGSGDAGGPGSGTAKREAGSAEKARSAVRKPAAVGRGQAAKAPVAKAVAAPARPMIGGHLQQSFDVHKKAAAPGWGRQ